MDKFLGKSYLLRLTNRVSLIAWKKLGRCFIFLPLSATLKLRNGGSVSTWKPSYLLSKTWVLDSIQSGQSSVSLIHVEIMTPRKWCSESKVLNRGKGSTALLHYTKQSPWDAMKTKRALAEACVCIFVPMHSIISENKKNQEGQIQRIPSLALQETQYRLGQGVRVCEISHSPVIWEVAVLLKDMKNMGDKKKFKWSQHLINQHSIKRKKKWKGRKLPKKSYKKFASIKERHLSVDQEYKQNT